MLFYVSGDHKRNRVDVQYWSSQFIGHAAHVDLLKHFHESIGKIDPSKIIHVSMDGPKANMKFYNELTRHRLGVELPQMLNIAVKPGVKVTDWSCMIVRPNKQLINILRDLMFSLFFSSVPLDGWKISQWQRDL